MNPGQVNPGQVNPGPAGLQRDSAAPASGPRDGLDADVVTAGPDALDRASRALRAGGLVVVPTDTVYGLAADATNDDALQRLFAAKGRPASRALPVLVASLDRAAPLLAPGALDARLRRLAERFWPGGLTVVVPAAASLSDVLTAGRGTVGLRVPAHGFTLELLGRAGFPLAVPSANSSERPSALTAAHARDDLGHAVALVVDDGPCARGLESTVIELRPEDWGVHRVGVVSVDELTACLGAPPAWGPAAPVAADGDGVVTLGGGPARWRVASTVAALEVDTSEVDTSETEAPGGRGGETSAGRVLVLLEGDAAVTHGPGLAWAAVVTPPPGVSGARAVHAVLREPAVTAAIRDGGGVDFVLGASLAGAERDVVLARLTRYAPPDP